MADPTIIRISNIALQRSSTPGVLPASLEDGEPFIQFADGFWLVGDGVSAPSDLPRRLFRSEEALLRPDGPIGTALASIITNAAAQVVATPVLVNGTPRLIGEALGAAVSDAAAAAAGAYPPETALASAATTDIGASTSARVAITGSAAITGFGTVANRLRFLRFTGAATLTHNATSLILPGAVNLVTAAGDTAIAVSDASGNWRLFDYQRGDGSAGLGLVRLDIVTTSQTVTVPSWARTVTPLAMGGAGGGGSGRRGAAGTVRTGGGAGGAGALDIETWLVSELGGSLSIGIGAGGDGGAAVAVNDTNGNSGTDGGNTTITANGVQILLAYGGTAGQGGSQSGAAGGTGGQGLSPEPVGSGAASSATGGGGAASSNSVRGSSGGGAGGGITSGNASSSGGAAARGYLIGGTGRRSGTAAGGAPGVAGSPGADKAWERGGASGGGGGGSGSGADATTPGGAGGTGGLPGGGGGGGGASTNGAASGAGGAGARGEVWLIWRA